MLLRFLCLLTLVIAKTSFAACPFAEQAESAGKADVAMSYYLYCAEENNDAVSQFKLGQKFYTGKGLKAPDYTRAVAFFAKSAYNGYAPAQASLGLLYWRGEGVEKNLILAHKWLYLAQEPAALRWFYMTGPTSDSKASALYAQLNKVLTLDSPEVKEAFPFSNKIPLQDLVGKNLVPSYKEVAEFQHKTLTEAGEELLNEQGQKDLNIYMRNLVPTIEPKMPEKMDAAKKQTAIKRILDWFKPVMLTQKNFTPEQIPVLNKLQQEINKPL